MSKCLLVALAAVLLVSPTARAADGVLEIGQACAVQTGCFPGDAPGFPVTIDGSAGRSYRLTGDLLLPDADATGIDIQADYIQLDLGGFAVQGVTTCTGAICQNTGSGIGVSNLGPYQGVRIRHGVVRGAGSFGVVVAFVGVAEDLIVTQNGGDGLYAGRGTRIESVSAITNGGDGIAGQDRVSIRRSQGMENHLHGIRVGAASRVESCSAQFNAGSGIFAERESEGVSVWASTASDNAQSGILLGFGALVEGSSATQNGSTGIRTWTGSLVRDSVVRRNATGVHVSTLAGSNGASSVTGNVVSGNTGVGIHAGTAPYSRVFGNVATGNGGAGIVATSEATVIDNVSSDNDVGLALFGDAPTYRGNSLADNATDSLTGVGRNQGGNYCAGPGTASVACP